MQGLEMAARAAAAGRCRLSANNGTMNGHHSVAIAWDDNAEYLGEWAEKRLVNRGDRWGGIRQNDHGVLGWYKTTGQLNARKLTSHFRGNTLTDIIGVYSSAPDADGACWSLWTGGDFDHHGEGPAPESTWKAALACYVKLTSLGFRPILEDSNGRGGYHVWILFSERVESLVARSFGRWLVKDWKEWGLESEPEIFPKQGTVTPKECGNLLRLPGRHFKHPDHFSRIWDGSQWLEGEAATDYLVNTTGNDPALIPTEARTFRQFTKKESERPKETGQGALEQLKHDLVDIEPKLGHESIGWTTKEVADGRTILVGECPFEHASGLSNPGDLSAGFYEEGPYLRCFHESCAGSKEVNLRLKKRHASKLPILGKRGVCVSCLHNALIWLADNGYGTKIRYDRFRHLILIDGRPFDDETVIAMTARIEASTRQGWAQEHVRSALVELAHRNEYSSLTEWLDSLKWDGTPRLDSFFHDAYACESSDYTEACAKVLFLSGVARAYQPGCQADVMVVLIGAQGIGKSMGMSALCPDPLWYADDLGCDLFDRKAGEGLRGKWLIEFSEFSRINRATLDVAKAFVTRRSDYYRPAYGRFHKDYPRTCIFVGTTNDDHPLHDRENRRLMPIHCNTADPSWIAVNRERLWAEAVSRYRSGEKWWVTNPEVVTEVMEKQEEARQNDFWEEVLSEKLINMQAVTMSFAAQALNIYNDRMDKSAQTRIGIALRSLGYTRKQVRNGKERGYVWTKPVSSPVTTF
jgi:predicted P-loop ATPase